MPTIETMFSCKTKTSVKFGFPLGSNSNSFIAVSKLTKRMKYKTAKVMSRVTIPTKLIQIPYFLNLSVNSTDERSGFSNHSLDK